MSTDKITIFLSYCSSDSIIADVVEESLYKEFGETIKISEYKKDVQYKQSFKEFMDTIQQHEFVLSIISDNYLKSQNCMYEIGEVLKNNQFKEQLLFLVLSQEDRKFYPDIKEDISAKIYEEESRIDYIIYWEEKYEKQNEKVKKIKGDIAKISSLENLKQVKKIYDYDMPDFLKYLSDVKGKSFTEFRKENFGDINEIIKKKL